MIVYLIKVNDLYYGREDAINGRIINPMYIDKDMIYYIVKENSYKTKQGAIKAAKKLEKIEKNPKISIQAIEFVN